VYNAAVLGENAGMRTLQVLLLSASALLALTGCRGEPADSLVAGAPGSPGPPDTGAARLVVVTHTEGFRHDSIPAAESALREIGLETGLYQAEFCRSGDEVRHCLSPEGLRDVDAVFFANTTGNIGIPDMRAFLDWIAGGKAFLGAHSATDTYHDSPEFIEMIGGEFETHGKIVEADVFVNDPSHPAVAHLAPRFQMTDEWYRFKNLAPDRHVLLSFDRVPPDGVGAPGDPADLPLAWHKSFGKGRVFYTAIGHRQEVWEDARFRRHLEEAIRWALGRAGGAARP
jgi:uncharacterized protein